MTPRLYEEVSNRFLSTWGEYAGWAHSVRYNRCLLVVFANPHAGTVYLRPKIVCITWDFASNFIRSKVNIAGIDPLEETKKTSPVTQDGSCEDDPIYSLINTWRRCFYLRAAPESRR